MRILLVVLFLCAGLFADRDGGPYLGAGYGISKYNDDGLYNTLKSDTSNAATLYAGAYINKHLSVELGYVNFDAWHVGKEYAVDELQKMGFEAITISTLAHYPFFEDLLDFYARFGVGNLSTNTLGADGFTMVVGGGVGLRLDEMLSLKIAYDMYNFNYLDETNPNNTIKYDMHIDYFYTALEVQF